MPTYKNTPLGLNLPLRNGPNSGYFDQSFDSYTQIRMNIINLLRTIPGERRMQPTFGCRLWNVVFEQNDEVVPEKINNIIREDVSRWIPGVVVKDITTKYYSGNETTDGRDIYKLYVVVKYTIVSINQSDVVEIYLDKGKV
jgi:phage baseplate assembly protein W